MGNIILPKLDLSPLTAIADDFRNNYLTMQRQDAEIKTGQAQVSLMDQANQITKDLQANGDYSNWEDTWKQRMSDAIDKQAASIPLPNYAEDFRTKMMMEVEKNLPTIRAQATDNMVKGAAGQAIHIASWIKILCALTMCAGTAAGGWRIIKTLGHKMVKLHPVHGFAAETTGATVLFTATLFGMPVSTTHVITTSIMGVGCAKGFNALRLGVVERILWAWVLTLPASAAVAYGLVYLARDCGWL